MLPIQNLPLAKSDLLKGYQFVIYPPANTSSLASDRTSVAKQLPHLLRLAGAVVGVCPPLSKVLAPRILGRKHLALFSHTAGNAPIDKHRFVQAEYAGYYPVRYNWVLDSLRAMEVLPLPGPLPGTHTTLCATTGALLNTQTGQTFQHSTCYAPEPTVAWGTSTHAAVSESGAITCAADTNTALIGTVGSAVANVPGTAAAATTGGTEESAAGPGATIIEANCGTDEPAAGPGITTIAATGGPGTEVPSRASADICAGADSQADLVVSPTPSQAVETVDISENPTLAEASLAGQKRRAESKQQCPQAVRKSSRTAGINGNSDTGASVAEVADLMASAHMLGSVADSYAAHLRSSTLRVSSLPGTPRERFYNMRFCVRLGHHCRVYYPLCRRQLESHGYGAVVRTTRCRRRYEYATRARTVTECRIKGLRVKNFRAPVSVHF